MRYSSRKKSAPADLVGYQGLCPPSSRMAHLACRKSSKGIRRPAWMNEELLTKLGHKDEAHKRWKQIR